MRTLKKTLCLVLALVLCLGLASTGFAASMDDFTDADQVGAQYEDAVEVMVALGIIDGMGESTLQPEGVYTREQAAKIIAYMTLGETAAEALTADSDPFKDVSKDRWSAGYIAYCAETGIVVGYGDGNYGPTDELTGYQFAKMLLSAVGLGEDNQYEGPNWAINVAKDAFPMGIFEGDVAAATHDSIQRQQATLMAFNMLTSEMKNSLVMGYQLSSEATNDAWGRPTTTWYKGTQQIAVTDTDPLATHDVAVSECQIATDMSESGTFSLAIWDNGIESSDTFNATSQAVNVGAQGTLIEVYSDRIVLIDTYLAQVSSVSEASYDDAGHLISAASSTLTVWFDANGITISGVSDTSYARGTYVLVNYNEGTKSLSIVQAADSFVGAQTRIWTNGSQHTIDGTTYDDAAHYALDGAGNSTVNFVWYLDQYGNVIGSVAIDRTSYAVLKDIIWVVGTPGYAQATLVYMDGTETTVVVDEFDGLDTNGWLSNGTDQAPVLKDSTSEYPGVSTDTKYNALYLGYALYEVTTHDNGTVDLDETLYAANANVDVGSSRIVINNRQTVYIDDNTQFLVKSGNTYTSYSRTTVPELANNCVIFYTVDNGIASRVYIKSGVAEAELGNHLFVTTSNYSQIAGTDTYQMDVVVDGVERTISTSKVVVEYLAANVGKLFHVTWNVNANQPNYGFVTAAYLVNEYEDIGSGYGYGCNYLTGSVTISGNTVIDGTSSYTIDSSTVFVGAESLSQATLNNNGVWIEYSFNGKYNVVSVVYVGTKLDESVDLTVTAEDGSVTYTYDADGNKTGAVTVTSVEDATSDVLTYTANDANSIVIAPAETALNSVSETVYSNNPSRSVTVWNEAGTVSKTYTISLTWTNDYADIFSKVTNQAGNTELLTGPVRGYKTVEMACSNINQLDLGSAVNVLFCTEPGALSIEYRVFTSTAEAIAAGVADYTGMTNNIINESQLLNGNILVVEVGTGEGTFYTAFQIINPEN